MDPQVIRVESKKDHEKEKKGAGKGDPGLSTQEHPKKAPSGSQEG